MHRCLLLLVALLASAPGAARDLIVPPDKAWGHAATGLVLPATIAGLPRTKIADFSDGEFDVVASYAGPDDPVFATVYLFQASIASAPMWFERSEWMIEHRGAFGSAVPTSAAPVAFALTESSGGPAAGLRRVYAPTRGGYQSTGLAIAPLRGWMVAVRMSSSMLAPAALDKQLQAFVAALRWPASASASDVVDAAEPIPACAAPLAFGKAKLEKSEGGNALMALLLGAVAHDPKVLANAKVTPVHWCRDPGETAKYAVYRTSVAPRTGYTVALADAGRTISVWPTLDNQTGKTESYAVAFHGVDGRTTEYGSFVGLPSPEQVMDVVAHGRATGGSSADGRTITINSSSLGK